MKKDPLTYIVLWGMPAVFIMFVMACCGTCGAEAQAAGLAACQTVREMTSHRVYIER